MQEGFVVSVTGGIPEGMKKPVTKSVVSALNIHFKPVSTISEHPSKSSISTAVLQAVGESLSSLAKQLGDGLNTVLVLTTLADLEGRALQLKKQEEKNPSAPASGQQDPSEERQKAKRDLRRATSEINVLDKETPKADRERDIEALKTRMKDHRQQYADKENSAGNYNDDLAFVVYYLDLLGKKTNIEDPKKRGKLLEKITGRISESSSSVLEEYLDMYDRLDSLERKLVKREGLQKVIEDLQKKLKELPENPPSRKPENAAELKQAAERVFLEGVTKIEQTGCSVIFSHAAKLPFKLTKEEQKILSPKANMNREERTPSDDPKAVARRNRQGSEDAKARRAQFKLERELAERKRISDKALAPLFRLIQGAISDWTIETKQETPAPVKISRQKISVYIAAAAYSETKIANTEWKRRNGDTAREINTTGDKLGQSEQEEILKIFNDIRNQHETPQEALLAATAAVQNATVVEREIKLRNILQEQLQYDGVAGFAWRVEYENRPAETGSDLCPRSGETQALISCLSNCLEGVDIPEHSEVTIYTNNTAFLEMMSHREQTGEFPEAVNRSDKRNLKDLAYILAQIQEKHSSIKYKWVLHGNQSMNFVQGEAFRQAVSAKRTSPRTAPAELPSAELC